MYQGKFTLYHSDPRENPSKTKKKQPHVFSSLKILKIRTFLCLLNFLRVMFFFLGDAAVYAHVH